MDEGETRLIAILLDGGKYVSGYFPDFTPDIVLPKEFVLREELPGILKNVPANKIPIYEDGDFILLDLPEPQESEPSQEQVLIEQLQVENADLKLRIGDIELALADIFTGGGE